MEHTILVEPQVKLKLPNFTYGWTELKLSLIFSYKIRWIEIPNKIHNLDYKKWWSGTKRLYLKSLGLPTDLGPEKNWV